MACSFAIKIFVFSSPIIDWYVVNTSTPDHTVTYFITNRIYDINEINAALFKYGQPILGE